MDLPTIFLDAKTNLHSPILAPFECRIDVDPTEIQKPDLRVMRADVEINEATAGGAVADQQAARASRPSDNDLEQVAGRNDLQMEHVRRWRPRR